MTSFVTSDGLQIHFRVWEGPGRPVVLHHGFSSDARLNWEATGVVDRLKRDGRTVVALDARGHGRSDKPHDADRYGESRMALDLIELVDHLGIDSYDLVGYSMGAVVSLLVATRDIRVRRLVVTGLGLATLAGGFDRFRSGDETVALALEVDDPGQISNAFIRSFRDFADTSGADRHALLAHVRATRPSPVDLGNVQVPTLVIAGVDDRLAPDADELADAIRGAEFRAVPGDHIKAPGRREFKEALAEFVTERPE